MCVASVVVACSCNGYRQYVVPVPGSWTTNIARPISDVDVERVDLQVQHRLLMDISDEDNPQAFEFGFELTHGSVISKRRRYKLLLVLST